ncbi:carboxylate-amine ligase [Tengunoibacter tsumagoiensis]|uniref:Putative glutamate--cysteine ligase 2 n=1 Tax=Tengunoibacter tsumagoiensis TaxID=2014871 RepID=A0A402A6J2_9CHLR|nr:glutamate--cysteine ligase [Tengunoibacter tsumagoiensis]GCE14709.1 putative glutamate--cysteine ligase 2 [Tengunoibacter tsumagoiensis]
MSSHSGVWTIGVEEEYQIIDLHTRALSSDAEALLKAMKAHPNITVQTELQRSQIEISTPICQNLSEVRTALCYARQNLIQQARTMNLGIAAAGTHPFSPWDEQILSPSSRYTVMEQKYQQLTREQVIFGCHIHVGCRDRDDAIQIANRARIWLAPLLALTANSPYWQGKDTGYTSFRTELWWRWPMAGPPAHFTTYADYQTLVQALVSNRSIDDSTHIYWDIRLSERFPTIEFRIMDVCLTVQETVMLTGIIRALVQTCYQQIHLQSCYAQTPTEILRNAHWRAARYGLEGELIDVSTNSLVAAPLLIKKLLDFVRPALEENGEWEEISTSVQTVLQMGNGATRQRQIYQKNSSMIDVVDFILKETAQIA